MYYLHLKQSAEISITFQHMIKYKIDKNSPVFRRRFCGKLKCSQFFNDMPGWGGGDANLFQSISLRVSSKNDPLNKENGEKSPLS